MQYTVCNAVRCGVTLRRQQKHPINNVCQLHTGEPQNGWAHNHEIPNKHSDSDESLENNASCLSLSSTGNIERGLDVPSGPHHRRPEETRFILVQNFYSPNMVYPLRNAMKPIFQVRDCRGLPNWQPTLSNDIENSPCDGSQRIRNSFPAKDVAIHKLHLFTPGSPLNAPQPSHRKSRVSFKNLPLETLRLQIRE